MEFAIERYEPNPHQVKEALLKNRTYHAYRWKEVYRLIDCTEQDAREAFKQFGNKYRLVSRDSGETIQSNVLATA